MRHLAKENDGFSDQHVWSTIRYLDTERSCQNAGRPVLVPVIMFLTFWIIFLASMYGLTVRVSETGLFPEAYPWEQNTITWRLGSLAIGSRVVELGSKRHSSTLRSMTSAPGMMPLDCTLTCWTDIDEYRIA
jgi:hypothetical protein